MFLKKEGSPEAVVFDFGGVIAEEGFHNSMKSMGLGMNIVPEVIYNAAEEAVFGSGYLVGRATEDEFWAGLKKRTHINLPVAKMRELCLSSFIIRPWMLDIVRQLRSAGVRPIMLSDQTDWLEELDRRHNFYCLFERVFNSYRTGHTKREAAAFVEVQDYLAMDGSEILFIDDRAGNVEMCRAQGWHGILYKDRPAFERDFSAYFPMV